MIIETIAVDRLTPYARNSRTHSAEQIAQIAASMREYGFTNPVLIDADDGIIAGHGRVLAATSIGIDAVPCVRLAHLTEAQKRAYVIADNKLALNAGWDEATLALELADLQGMDFDLSLTGFDTDELADLLFEEPVAQSAEDAVPPLSEVAVSQPGDVWTLGAHRLMCGDSTTAASVQALLAGATPHLMVTDPPYGIEYDANWRNETKRADGTAIGGKAIGAVMNDDQADWRHAWALFPGEVAYVWHGERQCVDLAAQLQDNGFETRNLIIWGKSQLVISRGHYHSQHEGCWYAVKKGKTGHWQGDRKQTTLWSIDKPIKSETGHSTQKPIECMRRPIENNSKVGDSVYEPFSGSGTTIIAAEQTGRKCYAMELSPSYVDLAVRRWQNYTGRRAVHAVTGQAFPA